MSRSCFDDNSARWDRERDERKHDPRPGDRDYVPLCAQAAPISTARDIAILVRALPNIDDATKLIEAYGRDKSSADHLDRVALALELPLSRREPV